MRYTVKDCFVTSRYPITHGTDLDYFTLSGPVEDCDAVKRLTDHELVGISGSTPFSCGNIDPKRFIDGLCAGGSSSGGPQDIRSGRCDFTLGTDVGGSCRTPALRAKILGFKASSDTISRNGVYSCCAELEAIGIMAASLKAIKTAFSCIGVDKGRSWTRVLDWRDSHSELDPLLPWIQGAWFARYTPEFFTNTLSFNGVYHKASPEGFLNRYRDRRRQGRDALPTLVRSRILAGAALGLQEDQAREKAIMHFRAALESIISEDCLLLLPAEPKSCYRAEFDDTYLLIANILDRPVVAIPAGERGLQLIGPRGSQVALLDAAQAYL